MKNIILLSNGYLPHVEKSISDDNNFCYLATILSNMAYYGYVPNKDVYETLKTLSNDKLVSFWKELESSFKKITFADKNMDSVVVYKNFPREVLVHTSISIFVLLSHFVLIKSKQYLSTSSINR